jgi:cobalt/nickel transport protein
LQNRNLPLLALLIFLGLMPFLWPFVPVAANALQKGTDDGARNAIREISPTFQPWSDSLWRPPDATSERVLFSLQAIAGGLTLYWAISALRKRKVEK